MTSRRGHARRSDEGSAVAFVPILGLLLFAGIAALIGIALQPSDAEATPEPAPITAAQLGRPCTEQVGPAPANAQARVAWLRAMSNCVNSRIEGALGAAAASTNSGFAGVVVGETFVGQPRVVVRWTEAPPAVVAFWAALHPGGVVTVATVPTDR